MGQPSELTHKWCNKCDRTLPIDKFGKDRNKHDGIYPYCTICKNAWLRANPARQMWVATRSRAKSKGIFFDLQVEDIEIPAVCPILGIPIFKTYDGKRGPTANSPSLDRINPEKGYTKYNIQVVSNKANAMKSNASPGQLLAFARWAIEVYGDE